MGSDGWMMRGCIRGDWELLRVLWLDELMNECWGGWLGDGWKVLAGGGSDSRVWVRSCMFIKSHVKWGFGIWGTEFGMIPDPFWNIYLLFLENAITGFSTNLHNPPPRCVFAFPVACSRDCSFRIVGCCWSYFLSRCLFSSVKLVKPLVAREIGDVNGLVFVVNHNGWR